jgi:hypothetical protein
LSSWAAAAAPLRDGWLVIMRSLTTTFFVYLRRRCTRVIDQQWLSVAMTCSERSLQRRHGLMKKSFVISVLAGVVLPMARLNSRASAQNGNPVNSGSANETTLAVFGDWPYGTNLLDSAPLLIDSINADPKVRLVMHVGDIHSGSMPCTGALGAKVPTVPATRIRAGTSGSSTCSSNSRTRASTRRATTSGPTPDTST